MWRRFIAPRPLALAMLALAAVSYALLSIVNHLCFHTFGLDLGLYTHALYNYAHFRPDLGTFYLDHTRDLLSDHFDLYLPLLSPLVWVFGQYTLLVVQIAAVLFGAAGAYKLVGTYGHPWLALVAMGTFLSFFGIWQALAFDYHSNVVACMLVPWLMYALRRQRYAWFTVLTMLVCLGKETLPLWLTFVLLALMWDYRRDRTALRWLAVGVLFCMVYLGVVTLIVMPALCPDPSPGFWRYSHMGDSFGEMARWLVTHPLEALRNLFVNHTADAAGNGLKAEFYLCLLASGGLLCLLKPNWLLMLVPLVAQKMLSRDIAFWGVGYHYNVEFATVVVPAAFIALSGMRSIRWRYGLAALSLALAVLTTVYTTSHPQTWIRRENVHLLDTRHYRNEQFSCREVREVLRRLPPDAAVCASSPLTPHLALRERVYLYPTGLAHHPTLLILTAEDAGAMNEHPDWQLVDTTAGLHIFTPVP